MTVLGYHCSHEQHPPSRLLRDVAQAIDAGFDAAMCSDHLSPWTHAQGESGDAWTWLGAAMQAVPDVTFGVVTAPGQRYHPVVAAQKLATLAELYPGRFWAAIGSGENMNEHVTGDPWPPKEVRVERMLECVDVMRRLLAGDEVTHDGLVRVDRARLWSLPASPPPLVAAAVSAETARIASTWADGLVTVAQPPDVLREVLDAWGGRGPAYLQVHISWALTEDEARAIALDQWSSGTVGPPACWDLPTPDLIEAATDPSKIDDAVIISADPAVHAERLDYLQGVGVTCIWLMPFYATPDKDDGYDITDYYGVDARLGDSGELVEMIRTAKDRGIRVIADLVVNHTSDQHPWFVEASTSRESRYHDWYVWADEVPADDGSEDLVFPGEVETAWRYVPAVDRWYHHRFYEHQPDLNLANDDVRREIGKIVGYWLSLGLDGFRVDAVPFLLEQGPEWKGSGHDPHEWMKELRAYISRRNGEAVLLGEVNVPPKDMDTYFGDDGDELQVQLAFAVNQAMWLSIVRGDARPLAKALDALPPLPRGCQYAHFLRNHDELSLDQLSARERAEVFEALAPDESMRVYDRGIRRRLPTMLEGDFERIRMAYALLLSLPGTPVLFYGEEIGMGENLDIPKRSAVRVPMQWTDELNGGFCDDDVLPRAAPIPDGDFGPKHVNVAAQRRDQDSLLNWLERLIRRRKETPELGFGTWSVLDCRADEVLALRADWEGRTAVFLHNLSARKVRAKLQLDDLADADHLTDLLESDDVALRSGRATIELGGYGWRWYRVHRPGERVVP